MITAAWGFKYCDWHHVDKHAVETRGLRSWSWSLVKT